jgi:hypothetical protein
MLAWSALSYWWTPVLWKCTLYQENREDRMTWE